MTMTNEPENPLAFPRAAAFGDGCHDWGQEGMTLRDYFAAAALQGMLNADYATPDLRKSGEEIFVDQKWVSLCGEQAYRFADAMLKARETSHDD